MIGEIDSKSDPTVGRLLNRRSEERRAAVARRSQEVADADSAQQAGEAETARLEAEKAAAKVSEAVVPAPTSAEVGEAAPVETPDVPGQAAEPAVVVAEREPTQPKDLELSLNPLELGAALAVVEGGRGVVRAVGKAGKEVVERMQEKQKLAESVVVPPLPPEPSRQAPDEKEGETSNRPKETKEAETKMTWRQANDILEQFAPQIGSPALAAEQRQAFDRAKIARDEMVLEAKREGLLGDILKDKVANAYDLAIRDARLALQANNPTDNPREVFTSRLRGVRPIREGEGRLDGVVGSWFAGVERNLDLSIAEGLASVREDLGMGEGKRLTKRAERLGNQIDVLNWGSLGRDETIDRLVSMADLCVEWERRYGPRAGDYRRAEESAARPPGGVDRNGLSDLMGIKTVEVKEDESSTPLFEEGGYFLKKYALPAVIEFSTGGLEKYRRKTTYALTDAILNGRLDSLTGSREFRSDVRLQNFLVFMSPLLTFRDKIRGGGFKNLTGDETDATPSALGALPFRSTLIYLADDPMFSRAVDIIMAADGRFGEDFLREGDKEFVDEFKAGFRALMARPGSNKERGRVAGYSQKEATEYMDLLSVKIADRLEIPGDVGVVYLARAMVAFMGHGLESTAMRNVGYLKQKDQVYRWVTEFRDPKTKGLDLALEPALSKVRIKGTPGLLAAAYANGGFAGVGVAAVNLNPGVDLNIWAFGMRKVTNGLEKIGRLINRGDSAQLAKDKAGVLKEIATTLGELTSGDIPQLGKETGEFVMRRAKEVIDPGGGTLANEAIQSHEEFMAETNRLADEISPTYVQRLRRFLGLRWRSS